MKLRKITSVSMTHYKLQQVVWLCTQSSYFLKALSVVKEKLCFETACLVVAVALCEEKEAGSNLLRCPWQNGHRSLCCASPRRKVAEATHLTEANLSCCKSTMVWKFWNRSVHVCGPFQAFGLTGYDGYTQPLWILMGHQNKETGKSLKPAKKTNVPHVVPIKIQISPKLHISAIWKWRSESFRM